MISVILGGCLGAICRYFISSSIRTKTFPLATFLINVTGSLLFGFIASLDLSKTLHLLFTTGFLGGFTTFSTFSFEAIQLIEKRKYVVAAVYVISSCITAILGVWIGYCLA